MNEKFKKSSIKSIISRQFCILCLIACVCLNSYARRDSTITRTDACCELRCNAGYSPVGIIADHIHKPGEWMFSYTYSDQMMVGNRSGSSKISNDAILNTYAVSPEIMDMQMHMLMAMYGLSNKFTLMGMLCANSNSMTMNMSSMNMMGESSISGMQNKTSGIGDTKLYALYNLINHYNTNIIIGLGLSIPTGSIMQNGMTANGDMSERLSYNMQPGTGSFGILPTISYNHQVNPYAWGVSAYSNLWTGTNSQGYRYGNLYELTGWFAYKWCRFISNSIRLQAINSGSIRGFNQSIATEMMADPTANPANYGGFCASAYLGMNFYVYKGTLKNLKAKFEYGMPFYQNLNGQQMSEQSDFIAGIEYSF